MVDCRLKRNRNLDVCKRRGNSGGKLNKNSREILKQLDGQEISSLRYEGVIGVKGNKIIREGKTIDTINTNTKAKKLMDEAFYDEFGYFPGSKQHERELKEEFG